MPFSLDVAISWGKAAGRLRASASVAARTAATSDSCESWLLCAEIDAPMAREAEEEASGGSKGSLSPCGQFSGLADQARRRAW